MTVRPKKLVIGIDYGTTNTGVAYAIVTDPKQEDVEINVIREWSNGICEDNIPSDIAYDEVGQPVGYGFDIPEGVQPLQWVKLLLDKKGLPKNSSGNEPIWSAYRSVQEPVSVIADYLRWLWSEIRKSLAESGDDVDAEEVVVVITVPASWPDQAKEAMHKAVHKAGIDADGRIIKWRNEPEAAAFFELKSRARKEQIAVGDCYIVCDAGGGTVDVASYQVISLAPLSVNQKVVSQGDLCGSAFINMQFETQIRSSLGSDYDRLSSDVKAQIRDKFERNIKRKYTPEKRTEFWVPVTGLEDNAEKGIKDGKLKIKEAILQRSFEEVMTQIGVLIDGQKEGLKDKGLLDNLKAILLVGGFGGSEYLQAKIKQEYPSSEGVKVWRGSHSWTAVPQGAVQCEVVNRDKYAPVNQRLSRYHYGIPYQRDGQRKVQWLLKKGQDMRDTSHIEPYIIRLEDQEWLNHEKYAPISALLVKSDKDQVTEDYDPSLEAHVQIHCQVETALRKSPEAKLTGRNPRVWQIPAELILAMDGPLLTIRCRIKGKDVGLLELQYCDDPTLPPHGLTAVQIMRRPRHADPASSARSSSILSHGSESDAAVVVSRSASKDTAERVPSVSPSISPSRPQPPSRPPSGDMSALSPRRASRSWSFWKNDSKDAEALNKALRDKKEEDKEREKAERRKKEEEKREKKNQPTDEYFPYVVEMNHQLGKLMLHHAYTGEWEDLPPKEAVGYGLH